MRFGEPHVFHQKTPKKSSSTSWHLNLRVCSSEGRAIEGCWRKKTSSKLSKQHWYWSCGQPTMFVIYICGSSAVCTTSIFTWTYDFLGILAHLLRMGFMEPRFTDFQVSCGSCSMASISLFESSDPIFKRTNDRKQSTKSMMQNTEMVYLPAPINMRSSGWCQRPDIVKIQCSAFLISLINV